MIDCPFLTEGGTCQHVDAAVGLPIIIHPTACTYCVEKHPDPQTRKDSYPVRCWTWKERKARGMEVGPAPRESASAVVVPRKPPPPPPKLPAVIPVVPDADDRLAICEGCDYWIGERCKVQCSCKQRPRPLADKGPDCFIGLWKR